MRKFLPIVLIIFIFLATPVLATNSLDFINQKVCDRFEEDINKLASIMVEVKERKGIKETRVAFGGIDTPVKSGDYWVTYGAEALAFQRVQKYSNKSELRYSLEVLKSKVLLAKTEVGRAIGEN